MGARSTLTQSFVKGPEVMPSTASNLMMTAMAFSISAEELHSANDPKHHLAILHLSATSLELSLKAWIMHAGGTEADLIKIGHRLIDAYSRSIELGLTDETGTVGEAIKVLDPAYRQNFTRYFPAGGFEALSVESLVDIARRVALAIGTSVWPDKN